MKRLWNNGLVGRREREAKLFERGLHVPTAAKPLPPAVPTMQSMAIETAAKTASVPGVSTGATSAGTGSMEILIIGIAVTVVVGVITYFVLTRHKRLPKGDAVNEGE
jgi:hypothetical protein